MRMLLPTYESREDIQPTVGLAVHLGALGAEVRVPLVPVGQPVRLPVIKATTPLPDLPPRSAEFAAARFDTVAVAPGERDTPVVIGVTPDGRWR